MNKTTVFAAITLSTALLSSTAGAFYFDFDDPNSEYGSGNDSCSSPSQTISQQKSGPTENSNWWLNPLSEEEREEKIKAVIQSANRNRFPFIQKHEMVDTSGLQWQGRKTPDEDLEQAEENAFLTAQAQGVDEDFYALFLQKKEEQRKKGFLKKNSFSGYPYGKKNYTREDGLGNKFGFLAIPLEM